MINLSPDDIEDQLDNFIIRKTKDQASTYVPRQKTTKNGEKIYDHIPLLIKDILASQPDADNKGAFTLFNPTELKYHSCLVYGFVAGRGVHNKSFYNYVLDDGTGSIKFRIYAKPREEKIIKCLYNEAQSLIGSADTLKYEKISTSMTRLLGKATEYIDGSVISPGSNVMLYGRPHNFKDQISLDVISFTMDNEKSRSLEIAFSESLIDYYQSHNR
ncbi:PREDICTED: uncharacterized protein LOC108612863 [Drosophila arizonae]|uniref:Uncharacterized protein LOC108612863 n=1 Tax=Drosophila arizonae TaxID=7263 RepID=A0ABM1P2G4_DROAR|nr:PREDICTED: uncharacterized protein LOC108612863 [Drosophila arizonae]